MLKPKPVILDDISKKEISNFKEEKKNLKRMSTLPPDRLENLAKVYDNLDQIKQQYSKSKNTNESKNEDTLLIEKIKISKRFFFNYVYDILESISKGCFENKKQYLIPLNKLHKHCKDFVEYLFVFEPKYRDKRYHKLKKFCDNFVDVVKSICLEWKESIGFDEKLISKFKSLCNSIDDIEHDLNEAENLIKDPESKIDLQLNNLIDTLDENIYKISKILCELEIDKE
ncbi:hypothetical protein GVAV_002574 [Gurleya vavrai]